MSQDQFENRKKQLQHLSAHIRSLSGVWHEISEAYKQRLVLLLNQLHEQVSSFLSRRELSRMLTGVAVFIGAATSQHASAQNFAPPVANVAGLSFSQVTTVEFADIDNDGDLDFFASNYYYNLFNDIVFVENTGTATNPSWGAPQSNPFGFTSTNPYTVAPRLVDIDGDGDLDMFTSEYDVTSQQGTLAYRENTGTPTSPQFGPAQLNPFGITGSSYADTPLSEFADIDQDGDYDLVMMDGDNYTYFLQVKENIGTPSAPAFQNVQPNPLSGLNPFYGYYHLAALGDMDYDGDLDIIVGNSNSGVLSYHENTGTPQQGIWDLNGVLSAHGLIDSGDYLGIPTIVDIDDDGDNDVVVGGYNNGIWFYENIDVISGLEETQDLNVSVYPNPAISELQINTQNAEAKLIELWDIKGRLISSWNIAGTTTTLDISEFDAGLYMLRVRSSSGAFEERVVFE